MKPTLPYCPHCGHDGTAIIHVVRPMVRGSVPRRDTLFRVECERCGFSTGFWFPKAAAIDAWRRGLRGLAVLSSRMYICPPQGEKRS